jgi:MFS superfamily sulfate permease-like transporter
MLALFVSVVTAVAVGMVLASLALVKRMADLQLASVELTEEGTAPTPRLSEAEQTAFDRCDGKTLLIHLAFSRFGLLALIKSCTRFRHRVDALNYAASVNTELKTQ